MRTARRSRPIGRIHPRSRIPNPRISRRRRISCTILGRIDQRIRIIRIDIAQNNNTRAAVTADTYAAAVRVYSARTAAAAAALIRERIHTGSTIDDVCRIAVAGTRAALTAVGAGQSSTTAAGTINNSLTGNRRHQTFAAITRIRIINRGSAGLRSAAAAARRGEIAPICIRIIRRCNIITGTALTTKRLIGILYI